MITPITPVPGWPKQGVSLRVDDGHVTLGDTTNFQWAILDEDGQITTGPARVALTPDQYTNWPAGEDDTYVMACVATNLGLTIAG